MAMNERPRAAAKNNRSLFEREAVAFIASNYSQSGGRADSAWARTEAAAWETMSFWVIRAISRAMSAPAVSSGPPAALCISRAAFSAAMLLLRMESIPSCDFVEHISYRQNSALI